MSGLIGTKPRSGFSQCFWWKPGLLKDGNSSAFASNATVCRACGKGCPSACYCLEGVSVNELMHLGGLSLIRRGGGKATQNKEAERNGQSCVFWCNDAVWDWASLGLCAAGRRGWLMWKGLGYIFW